MEKQSIQEATEPPVKKLSAMQHLKIYNKADILSLTRIRRFETKLGERLQVIQDANDIAKSLATSTAKYILFGVPEDLGAKGNLGIGGTDTLWIPFLQSFLNIQSNDFFDGGEVLLLGHFDLVIYNT
jgi:formiminoglutamase